ncbi:hypothetical protein GJAV_G00229240 [Gymnothorax javanicus]|nr:hypothetical protein GJAV_G00229240 [Gymnothorax javanicus]
MTPENILQRDWYAVLDACPSDCIQELKHKYQRLVLQYHPDKQAPDTAAVELERRLEKFIEVDQAWKILGSEDTKRAYDLQRRAQELKQNWPIDARICLEEMDWDHGEEVYRYGCRCGGEFLIGKEETEEEEESVICCDTCSLSIEVKMAT